MIIGTTTINRIRQQNADILMQRAVWGFSRLRIGLFENICRFSDHCFINDRIACRLGSNLIVGSMLEVMAKIADSALYRKLKGVQWYLRINVEGHNCRQNRSNQTDKTANDSL